MNLTCKYLDLDLKNPIIAASSKITGNLNQLQAIENAGAAAVVVKSIFEEQISGASKHQLLRHDEYFWFQEAADMIDRLQQAGGVAQQTNLINEASKILDIPVIASINCATEGNWVSYAKEVEIAGAAALELNMGIFPRNQHQTADEIEATYVNLVKAISEQVAIPVSVKLGHYFTNTLNMGKKLKEAGAKGVVLFNRFYQINIDIDQMKTINDQWYSSDNEITLPLRWVALFKRENIGLDVSASTGIHSSEGIIKQLLAGANTVQLSSVLYKQGIDYIEKMLNELELWMKNKGFTDIEDFRGAILKDPVNHMAFERIQFMKRNFEN